LEQSSNLTAAEKAGALAGDRESFNRGGRGRLDKIPFHRLLEHMLDNGQAPVDGGEIARPSLLRLPFFNLPRGDIRQRCIGEQLGELVEMYFSSCQLRL